MKLWFNAGFEYLQIIRGNILITFSVSAADDDDDDDDWQAEFR